MSAVLIGLIVPSAGLISGRDVDECTVAGAVENLGMTKLGKLPVADPGRAMEFWARVDLVVIGRTDAQWKDRG